MMGDRHEDRAERTFLFGDSNSPKMHILNGIRVVKCGDNEELIAINGKRCGWGCAIIFDKETAKEIIKEIEELL